MDELSEILILIQEGKMPKMPVFLIGKSFWRPLDRFFRSRFLGLKTIKKKDLDIYEITDDINKVVMAANKIGHPKVADNLYDDFIKP